MKAKISAMVGLFWLFGLGHSFADPLTVSTLTVTNQMTGYSTFRFGTAAVQNSTANATTGGSLSTGTYYYKVWPISSGTITGFPSPEMIVTVSGANNKVNISWDSVQNAGVYRISRGTSQGAYDGYFQSTSTSISDIGQGFSGVDVVANGLNRVGGVSGAVYFAEGISGLNWYSYMDGALGCAVGGTSAGELNFLAGRGSGGGNFIFLDSTDQQKLVIQTATSEPAITFGNASGTGAIESSVLKFISGGTERFRVTSASVASSVPIVNPAQPDFLANYSGNQNNVTGAGEKITMSFNNEIYDQTSGFNGSTFTAPNSGRYLLCASVYLYGITTSQTTRRIDFYTSNRIYTAAYVRSLAEEMTIAKCTEADMDANDTVYVVVAVSGPSTDVDIGGNAPDINYFSATLLN